MKTTSTGTIRTAPSRDRERSRHRRYKFSGPSADCARTQQAAGDRAGRWRQCRSVLRQRKFRFRNVCTVGKRCFSVTFSCWRWFIRRHQDRCHAYLHQMSFIWRSQPMRSDTGISGLPGKVSKRFRGGFTRLSPLCTRAAQWRDPFWTAKSCRRDSCTAQQARLRKSSSSAASSASCDNLSPSGNSSQHPQKVRRWINSGQALPCGEVSFNR